MCISSKFVNLFPIILICIKRYNRGYCSKIDIYILIELAETSLLRNWIVHAISFAACSCDCLAVPVAIVCQTGQIAEKNMPFIFICETGRCVPSNHTHTYGSLSAQFHLRIVFLLWSFLNPNSDRQEQQREKKKLLKMLRADTFSKSPNYHLLFLIYSLIWSWKLAIIHI